MIERKLVNKLKPLGDLVKGLILYGSIAKGDGYYIPGESDIDFYLVVDGENLLETYDKISQVVEEFRREPLFAPLLDLRVVEEDETSPKSYDALGTLLALGASQGKALLGENVLADIEFPETIIQDATRAIIYNTYAGYIDVLTSGSTPYETALVGVEHVLTCAHAYLVYEGEVNHVRYELPEIFQDRYEGSNLFNVQTLFEAHRYRLGIQNMIPEEFIPQAFEFCKAVKSQIALI